MYESLEVKREPFWSMGMVKKSYYIEGEIDKARQISNNHIQGIKGRYGNNFDNVESKFLFVQLSISYLIMGDQGKAFDFLKKAIEAGYLWDLNNEKILEPLYDHPRFQELVEKQKKRKEEVMALVATYNFPEPEDL